MSLRIGFVMDPISRINIKKDSTFAMMLEAQRRKHELLYLETPDLLIRDGQSQSVMRPVRVFDNPAKWYEFGEPLDLGLDQLHIIMMRKDPPFNMDYVYSSYALDLAELNGALVVNRPQALRDANEKLFTSWFPQCCIETLVTRNAAQVLDFISKHGKSVVKPLDGMGGQSVFQLKPGDDNLNVILETVSNDGRELVMVQRYIEEISAGDKRILMIDGQPVPYALARIPGAGDFRGNLAKGGTGKGVPLSDRDYWICEQVGPELSKRGIWFAGLDVIGDYLTEINVTSPTCIRELDLEYGINIAGDLFDVIEEKVTT